MVVAVVLAGAVVIEGVGWLIFFHGVVEIVDQRYPIISVKAIQVSKYPSIGIKVSNYPSFTQCK